RPGVTPVSTSSTTPKPVSAPAAAPAVAAAPTTNVIDRFVSWLSSVLPSGTAQPGRYALRPNGPPGVNICWDTANDRAAEHYDYCKPSSTAGLSGLGGGVLAGGRFGSLG